MRSPRVGVLGLRPADLLVAALGVRPRPRLLVGPLASAAAADVSPTGWRLADARQHALGCLEIGKSCDDRCAFGIKACKPLADLDLLRADLVQYRCCASHCGF